MKTAEAVTSGPSRGRSPARRRALLDAARRVIDRRGPNVSMEQIASEAGISRPILYRHFGDRQGMAEAIAADAIRRAVGRSDHGDVEGRDVLQNVLENGEAGFDQTFRQLASHYLDFVEHETEVYRFTLQERAFRRVLPGGQEALSPLAMLARPLISALENDGLPPREAALHGHAVAGLLPAIIDCWLESGDSTREEIEGLLIQMAGRLVEGIRPA